MEQIRENHNVQIWNAIDAKNYKQAIKIIEKRLSKGPDEYLEALKFQIRGKQRHFTEKSSSLLYLEGLTSRNPPLRDIDAIDLYGDSLDEILPECNEAWARIIGELKWECVKLSPKNEALCLRALEACLFKDDLHHARQIVNSIEKNFPTNRYYVFWSVSILFLYSLSDKYPDDQKKLWGNLAFAQIKKLAGSTRLCTDLKKLPLRSIQTPQEILLLHRLIKAYGKPEQSIEYLEDSQFGPDSPLAKGEWELWRTKLKLLGGLMRWEELFNVTISLLQRARTKNLSGQIPEARMGDWVVWESLIQSAVELKEYIYFSKIRTEIEAQLDPEVGIDKSWRRNASLAWVKFCFESNIPFSTSNEFEKDNPLSIKLIAIAKYLEEYGNASIAYSDLRPFIEILDPEERIELLKMLTGNSTYSKAANDEELAALLEGLSLSDLSTASLVIQAVNRFKIRYLLTCCIPNKKHSQNSRSDEIQPGALLELAKELIETYQATIKGGEKITKNLLMTDRHPADDLAVLASMCLIKLGLHEAKNAKGSLNAAGTSHFLQATALLEYTLKNSRHNYHIILILVRVYTYLGCGSLAMKNFHCLSLKQVQNVTLSHIMYDRISTLHPHPFDHLTSGKTKKMVPIEHLQSLEKFLLKSKDQVSRNIWIAFKHGSYNSLFEMTEFSERLLNSTSSMLCVIESRKILRILSPTTDSGPLPQQYQNTSPMEIPRFSEIDDCRSFPSFESSYGPTFYEICSFFPPPTINRYWNSLLHEHFIHIISQPEETARYEYTVNLKWLKDYALKHKENINLDKTGMTPSEELAHQIYHSLALTLREVCDSERWQHENLQQNLEIFTSDVLKCLSMLHQLVSDQEFFIPASQVTLHVLYTARLVGNTILDFCNFTTHLGELVYERQAESNKKINEAATALLSEVAQKSTLIKNSMNESGWIDKVLENISDDLRDIVNETFIEEWAGLVVESWRESTVGLNYLKMVET